MSGNEIIEMPKSAAAELGKKIVLGATYRTVEMPEGRALAIKRMPMSAELRFIDLYNKLIEDMQGTRKEVFDKIRAYMEGAKQVNFGLMEGLQMIGNVLGQLESVQDRLAEGILILADLQKVDIDLAYIKNNLATADCMEILTAQAEVQGLLGSFRGLLAGLGSAGN